MGVVVRCVKTPNHMSSWGTMEDGPPVYPAKGDCKRVVCKTTIELSTNGLSMDTITRVGVVEIGSRAVRLLVADISVRTGLTVVATDYRGTQLVSAVMAKTDSVAREINEVSNIVHAFLERCRDLRAAHISIFGTAAIRALQQKSDPLFQELLKLIPNMRVLSKRSEALCSLVAAVKGHPSEFSHASNVIAIDQGAGSTEIAVGHVLNSHIELADYNSYSRLGTNNLVGVLKKENNKVSNLKERIYGWFNPDRKDALKPPGKGIYSPTVLFGSAATKFALVSMRVRENKNYRYAPHLVHGKDFNIKQLDGFIDHAIKNPDPIKLLIDPENPDSDECNVVISGLVALSALIHELKKDKFIVSGFGTRHGMAWDIATNISSAKGHASNRSVKQG